MTETYTAVIHKERRVIDKYGYKVEIECYDYEIFQELVEHIRTFGRSAKND